MIGLEPGRYLGRDPAQVLVLGVTDAPAAPRRRLRKAKPSVATADSANPPVPLTTLSVIRPEPLGDANQARAWLGRLREDEEALEAELDEAVLLVNRAVHAFRTTALDPDVADVSPARALTVRLGFGEGEGLAEGRWREAIELPRGKRRRRLETLAPQEMIAAVLARRTAPDAFTAALLRARTDLDAGRDRDAALQLRVGLEALLADRNELRAAGQTEDLERLSERRTITGEAANEALAGALTATREAEIEETLRICERVLRRRRALG